MNFSADPFDIKKEL